MPSTGDTGPAELDLSDDVADVLDHAPIPGWRLAPECHGVVRAVAAAARPVLPEEAATYVATVSEFYGAMTQPPTSYAAAVAMLTEDRVDVFIASAEEQHPAVHEGWRQRLALVGREVNPPGWTTVPEVDPGPWVPYWWPDVQSLYRSLGVLPWLDAVRAFGVITVGIATGATAEDLTVTAGSDINVTMDGSVRVTLSHPLRDVPALSPFRHALLRLMVHRRDVLSGVGPMSTSALTTLTDRVATDSAPPLVLTRLRATWLSSHLLAGTPLHLLAPVAGPTLLDDVAQVLPHLPAAPPDVARRWLTLGGAA